MIVIGASGYIGNNLLEHFSKKEESVGTYFHTQKKGLLYFDLKNPDLTSLGINLRKERWGVICSAVSKIDECKRNEEESYQVNVLGIERALEQFFDYGIKPIFLSSDFVFDGKTGNYKEDDKRNPCTVYGKHKKIIEDFLITGKKDYLIVRLSKIFGTKEDDGTLLTSMLSQLRADKEISCSTDQFFCPTHIDDLVKAVDLTLQRNLAGVYNVASSEVFSRFELGEMLKTHLKINTGKVKPCLTKDFNFLDFRSMNTSMDCQKFVKDTKYEFNRMEDCINELGKFL
jgi:dTDP-4-dehydrorhamnose reductase